MKLGDFGDADKPIEAHTFGWFGRQLRANPLAGDTTFVDFIEEYGNLDENDPRAITGTKAFLRSIVHEDDFATFWRVGREHGQQLGDFAEVAMKIIEALVGRPTDRSSDSPVGPSETAESSTDGSYSRVIREHEDRGRPDLAAVYYLAQEARRAG